MKKELTFYLTIIGLAIIAATVMTMKACSGSTSSTGWNLFSSSADEKAKRDSLVIETIQQHSRLYTAETTSHKTITYTSQNKFKLKLLGFEKDVNLPLTKTEAVIPVDVKYKAFIDLDKVSNRDFRIDNDTTIYITLPDPVIEETAVSIDHENEKMKKQWLGKGLTYEQYQQLVKQAKEEAWNELSEDDQRAIIETAKVSATDILLPQLRSLGFEHIYIDYRKEFTLEDILKIKRKD